MPTGHQDKEDLPVNAAAKALYDDYLKMTGDNGAAATLTLADVMQTTLDEEESRKCLVAVEAD